MVWTVSPRKKAGAGSKRESCPPGLPQPPAGPKPWISAVLGRNGKSHPCWAFYVCSFDLHNNLSREISSSFLKIRKLSLRYVGQGHSRQRVNWIQSQPCLFRPLQDGFVLIYKAKPGLVKATSSSDFAGMCMLALWSPVYPGLGPFPTSCLFFFQIQPPNMQP